MEVKSGFQMSDVGLIPEAWQVGRLGDLAEMSSGGTPPTSVPAYYSGGIPWVSIADMTQCGKYIEHTGRTLSALGLLGSAAHMVPAGTLLYAMYASLGECSIASAPVCTSQAILGIRVKGKIDHEFLYYYMIRTRGRVRQLGQHGTQANLNKGMVEDFPIPLPTKAEQRAIAEALSDVDALLDGLDRLIAKKRDIKQAAMQQLLTGRTRLLEVDKEWEVKSFDAVLERWNVRDHQIHASDYRATGALPIVDQGKQAIVGFSDQVEKRFRCPIEGVIVFGDHTCIVKFIDFDFLVGADGTQVLRGRAGQSTRFHAYQLQYLGIEATGYNRHYKLLRERVFPCPVLAEQNAIATVLSDMDAELTALEARRYKTRALKQAMMQELLSGRTRLVPAGVADA